MAARELLVLAGPTGVGKSALAVEIARAVGGEVVSADSRQLYRGLDVGTATPTAEEQGGVRHHLLDVLDPGERANAGWYLRQAHRVVADCWRRGRPVVVVGGSTLYVHALVAGLADLPPVSANTERQLAAEIERPGGAGRLFQELARADPEAAGTLDPTKSQRLVRLVGVVRETGRPVSERWKAQDEAPFRTRLVVLDRPRAELYARIEARVDRMIAGGLEREVASVLEQEPGSEPLLNATIGYREWLPVLAGDRTREEAVRLVKRNSRRYAKRQLTWYRRYPDALWLGAESATAAQVLRAVAPWPSASDDGRATRGPGPLPTR